MNSKLYILSCTLLACASIFTTHSNSAKKENYQYASFNADKNRLLRYAPIMSKNDMRNFFERIFDQPEYAQDILPNDFFHFIQCLSYTQNNYHTRMHGKHVFRLFASKLRDSDHVSPDAYARMLEEITPILMRYVHHSEQTIMEAWQKNLDSLLSNAFLNHFSEFKEKPFAFLHALSGSIANTLFEQEQILGDINLQEFRETIVRFLELGLNKLVWDPEDGIQTWKQVKTITNQLARCSEQKLFNNDDDFQDLKDCLIKRYCFFLEIVSTELSLEFYNEIKRELTAQTIELIDSEELEVCIETKRQRLIRALIEAETSARIYQHAFATT